MIQGGGMMRVLATGTIMVDILAVDLPHIAEPGKVVYSPKGTEFHIGGHPVDVAIDLIKLGCSPDSIAIVAAIGKGIYGAYAENIIHNYGIRTFFQNMGEVDTGTNVVLSVRGEDRRFHITPGANWFLSAEEVLKAVDEWNPDIFCVRPGYSGIDLELDRILASLKKRGVFVFLDLMQPHPDRPSCFLKTVYRYADLIHCNEREALINTGKETLEDAFNAFFRYGASRIVVTNGENGVRFVTPSHSVRQPAFDVDVVDPTGCGDAFCAGVVCSLMRQGVLSDFLFDVRFPKHLAELLLFGQAAGASAATVAGCTEGVSREKVDSLLKSQGGKILGQTQVSMRN